MKLLYIGILALLVSCTTTLTADPDVIEVKKTDQSLNKIDSLVIPYREALESEMLEIIAQSEYDFTKGRPNGALNNWAADAILDCYQVQDSLPVMCLLNVGGLRNPISKGDVKLEDIFKLMPFDNEVVVVKMPITSLEKISYYLSQSGGEPIAGVKMSNGKLFFDVSTEFFYVITSDYLLNGGDKMYFFEDNLAVIYTNILMRDAMIEEAKKQKVLKFNDEERIQL